MLQRLIAARLITPPAIWGKLPAHADFVRSGVRHGESDAWRPWLAAQGDFGPAGIDPLGALPAAFVLPPATLACSPRCFIVGVIAASVDRVGRHHPLLVYQMARQRWVHRHFRAQAVQPRDWFFWLARAVGQHLRNGGDMMSLELAVRALWQLHAPRWPGIAFQRSGSNPAVALERARVQSVIGEWAGPLDASDPARHLLGARHMPWGDWPQRLLRRHADSAFWQQDVRGGYVNAAIRLKDLWGSTP